MGRVVNPRAEIYSGIGLTLWSKGRMLRLWRNGAFLGAVMDRIEVLLVENDQDDFDLVRNAVGDGGDPPLGLHWRRRLGQAMERLAQGRIDVVLLDFELPDSSGWETFTRLHARAPDVPLIVLTRVDDESLGLRAVRSGAQDYLFKHLTHRDQLIRAIRYAIERKRSEVSLRRYRDHLEELVQDRTAELVRINNRLQVEVTERRAVEEQLKQAINRLEVHDQTRSQFVSNVSHELRTPLSSMGYAVENLLRGTAGPLPERVRFYLTMLADDCRRLHRTVDDILDMSRLDAGRLELHRVRLPFGRFVGRTLESMHFLAEAKRQSLQTALHATRLFADIDPHKMARVLANLVENAIKFTPERGEIRVEVAANGSAPEEVLLRVLDNGSGIPSEHLERVTERYYRVGEHVSGTGLGLAMAREIVELHGGVLRLASPPADAAAGTEVEIRLAAVEPPLVLAVDDSGLIRKLLAEQMGQHGYRVRTAGDGTEALRLVAELHPDLLVLDLLVPGVEGVEIIARMKSDTDLRRIPILVITGAQIDETRREILDGFDIPALAKPWKQADLLNRLEEVAIGRDYLA